MDIRNVGEYVRRFIYIRAKSGKIIPLQLNRPQQRLYDAIADKWRKGEPARVIVLKARQMGFSTASEAFLFALAATNPNWQTLIVAHREDSTANLFNMNRRFFDCLPQPMQPMLRKSNAREILFENPDRDPIRRKGNPGLGSRIRCVTAGAGGAGRGDTFNAVHVSEYAWWPGDKQATLDGIMQCLPDDETRGRTVVIVESTANGIDEFYKMWRRAVKGESNWIPFFAAWHEMESYRTPVEPGTEWTPEELAEQKKYNLDEEQLMWRRCKIRDGCGGSLDTFHQEYPACPEEAFLFSGRPVFDPQAILARLDNIKEPVKTGDIWTETVYDGEGEHIRAWEFRENEKGYVKIYREPEQGHHYVIGGDTAGDGSDYYVAQVIDNSTGEQVAVARHRMGEELFPQLCFGLGRMYHNALISIEANFSTYPAKMLARWGYEHQYVREKEDTATGGVLLKYGPRTTSITRPVMISTLTEACRDRLDLIHDRDTLEEMLSFVYDDNQRPAAQEGEHDDCVMALAIAHYSRGQEKLTVDGEPTRKVKWTKDKWEDYRRADENTRMMLIRKWGNPF